MVSLWWGPSPVRDLEFLLLEENHCLTSQHTTILYMMKLDGTLSILFAPIRKVCPYSVGAGPIQLSKRSDVQEKTLF